MKSRGEALRDYVVRRLLLMIPTFIGITLSTFLLCQFVPGGQIDQLRIALAGAGDPANGCGSDARSSSRFPMSSWQQLRNSTDSTGPYPSPTASGCSRRCGSISASRSATTSRCCRSSPNACLISIYYGLVTAFFTYGICIPLGIVKASSIARRSTT